MAVGPAHVVQDKPVPGDQEYVVPPVAPRVVDEPLQIATPAPALTVGVGFTLIFVVVKQPVAKV